MSNFRAIATVTATLRELLQTTAGVDLQGHTMDITVLRPDTAAKDLQGSRVNIYLYQVTPNAALLNNDLPTRRVDGTVVQRPQVALDLHYMISFYSGDNEFVPQLLLGSVVRTLHAEPLLTRDRIRQTIPNVAADGQQILADSNLADQVELVKFTPLHLSLEEFSKIWSIFYQIPYVLSVAYQASVVLIEQDIPTQNALPVFTRNIYADPFHQPTIQQILAKPEATQSIGVDKPGLPITLDKTLLIQGHNLQGGKGTLVQIDGIVVQPSDVTDSQITLSLPTVSGVRLQDGATITIVDGLRTGVQGLQVIHRKQMGVDKDNDELNWHYGVESNVAAFVLRPVIVPPVTPGAGLVTVKLKPVVSRPQRVVLLLNEFSAGPRQPGAPPARAYSFIAKPGDQAWKDVNGKVLTAQDPIKDTDSTDTIKFSITGVAPGPYLVRVQVDGAESLLTIDADPNRATFNRYTGPQVTI
jgi:Pvc16 N-terminal domain